LDRGVDGWRGRGIVVAIDQDWAGFDVSAAVALATAAAASPIPFSDAALLVPIQVGMLTSITLIFGVPIEAGFLSTLVASAVGGGGAMMAGRVIVAGLLKAEFKKRSL
jgi:uncharacterized protein (DUF697 family)